MARSSPLKSAEPQEPTPAQLEAVARQAAEDAEQASLAHIRRIQNEAAREIALDRLGARDPAIAELIARTRADAVRIAELEARIQELSAQLTAKA